MEVLVLIAPPGPSPQWEGRKGRAFCTWSSWAWMQHPWKQITLQAAVDTRLRKNRDAQPICGSPATCFLVPQPCPALVWLPSPDIPSKALKDHELVFNLLNRLTRFYITFEMHFWVGTCHGQGELFRFCGHLLLLNGSSPPWWGHVIAPGSFAPTVPPEVCVVVGEKHIHVLEC